jgi:PAS domain S-box-containing protein
MVQSSLLRYVLMLSVAAIVLFPLYAFFHQYPAFERLLTENTTREAERIAAVLSSLLPDEQLGLDPDRTPEGFNRHMENLLRDTHVLKAKIFSPTGRILSSTDPREIGRMNEEDYFQDIVRSSRRRSQEIARNAPTLERQILPADVVETYVPIVKDGRTIAVFEIYYDISAEKKQLKTLVRRSAGSVLILACVLLIAVLISVQKAKRVMQQRKLAEEALVASEERYRMLFERAGDAIFILGTSSEDAGRIIDANRAAAVMHLYTVEELRQLRITDLDAPESAAKAPQLMERISRGEWIKTELVHQRKDGTVFPVEVSAGLLELGGRKYILAFDRDITVRCKIEEGRERVIDELREALENISTLRGLLPICSSCKKIRDDRGYWNRLESYIESHTRAEFSHGLCPDCMVKLYPEVPLPKDMT